MGEPLKGPSGKVIRVEVLSPEARAELVRLAQEATHGVWHVWSSLYEGMKAAIVVVTPDDKSNTLFEARNYPDAVYVAAANPEAILSYEATVQALTVERDEALERVKALEAGLRFYADPISYALTQVRDPRSAVHGDNGNRARALLTPKDPGHG